MGGRTRHSVRKNRKDSAKAVLGLAAALTMVSALLPAPAVSHERPDNPHYAATAFSSGAVLGNPRIAYAGPHGPYRTEIEWDIHFTSVFPGICGVSPELADEHDHIPLNDESTVWRMRGLKHDGTASEWVQTGWSEWTGWNCRGYSPHWVQHVPSYNYSLPNGYPDIQIQLVGESGKIYLDASTETEAPPNYVALGDSFQSGVGIGTYFPETNTSTNKCQRSAGSYAPQIAPEINVDLPLRWAPEGIPLDFRFVACSGATTEQLHEDGQWGEPAQVEAVDANTRLVTIGVGGDDLGFGDRIKDCVLPWPFGNFGTYSSCEGEYDERVTDDILKLVTRGPDGFNRLQSIYRDIREKGPRAPVYVLGYPRFFVERPSLGITGLIDPLQPCDHVRLTDQIWINYKILQLDRAIEASARSMGAHYVDLYDASDDHEICNQGGEERFINGITPSNGWGDSFHPTAFGYGRIADILRGEIGSPSPSTTYTVHPGQTITTNHNVTGGPAASFATTWPGSDVEMTLVSPSGRIIDRQTTASDVYHHAGPTSELYYVENPEAGEWTVRLHGLDVDPEGEPTTLDFYEMPRPNEDPVARITMTQNRRTVTLDAGTSTDADGEIVDYLWEFDDGTFANGSHVTHTYEQAGTHHVTLVTRDDQGGLGFDAADEPVVIPTYDFQGFYAPINNQPVLNTTQAGRAIPVKFGLGRDEGLDIFASGNPKVRLIDCVTGVALDEVEQTVTAGSSELTYDAGSNRYTYVWKTEPNWAGSCRRLALGLGDGSVHSADFMFR